MMDAVMPYLGEISLGVCAGICTVAYWMDARYRRRRTAWLYAKMSPLSRSTTERRD